MHEWSLTGELLDTVCTQAKENGISKITKIQVDLGGESDITEESLRFCFRVLIEKTIVSGAELEISLSTGRSLSLVSLEGE